MAMTFMSRRPDSGLGKIRSIPADPSRKIDWVLLTLQGILMVAGCFVVYSASRTRIPGDPLAFADRQVVFAIVGAVVTVVVMSIDYATLRDRATALYAGTLALLVLLLLIGLTQGADRISFDLGPFNLQPAELAKFSTMALLATYLAETRTDEVSYSRFIGGLVIVGLPTLLVVAQPDLGSASVLV
ncbi:MAG: FtsW/RodA/SpoVE family cell cycle protein, partial [Ilumatobacter sp.]